MKVWIIEIGDPAMLTEHGTLTFSVYGICQLEETAREKKEQLVQRGVKENLLRIYDVTLEEYR